MGNDSSKPDPKGEAFKYYETHSYDLHIADVVSTYQKSVKKTEDENRIIDALEILAMKKFHEFSAPKDFESRPSILKIMDLLLCVEEIAMKKYTELEKYTSQYVSAPEKFQPTQVESTFIGFEEFFERIADCVCLLCTVYEFDKSHLPLILVKYMLYHSRSVLFDLKIYRLMRNFAWQRLQQQIQRESKDNGPLTQALDAFNRLAIPGFLLLTLSEFNAPKFLDKIMEARDDEAKLGRIQVQLNYVLSKRLSDPTILDELEGFNDRKIYKKNFKLTCSQLCSRLIPNDKPNDNNNSTNINDIVGYFKFMQLIFNEEVSAEAIASLIYSQIFFCTICGQQEIPGIKDVFVEEMKRMIKISQDPQALLTVDFALLMEGLQAINSLHSLYFMLYTQGANDYEPFAKNYLDSFFKPSSNQILTLFRNIRGDPAAVKTPKSKLNVLFNSGENVYYSYVFSILNMIDELQKVNSGKAGDTIAKYDILSSEMLKLLQEEVLSTFNSSLSESLGLVYWGKLLTYQFKWSAAKNQIQGFCHDVLSQFQTSINNLLNSQKLTTLSSNQSQAKYIFLNLHSLTVTTLLSLGTAFENGENELKLKFVSALRLEEALKVFEELRVKVDFQSNKLAFAIVCRQYLFYFAVCSTIYLPKDKQDLAMTVKQFEKIMWFAVVFSHPDLRYPTVFLDFLTKITNLASDSSEYLRSLNSSGFVEHICKELIFEFNAQELVQVGDETIYKSEIDFNSFKKYLYDQMIQDKNYQRINKIMSIYKEKAISAGKNIKSRLIQFRTIHDFEKNRFVSDYRRYGLDLKLFIQVIGDLFEQSRTKRFEKEPEAQELMKTLQESLIFLIEISTSLPVVGQVSTIPKSLVNLLSYVNVENQVEYLKPIRTAVLSHLNAKNQKLVGGKYHSITQTSASSSDESKLFEFLMAIVSKKALPTNLEHYIGLESVVLFMEALDDNLAQKLANKLKDRALLSEDLQTLIKLLNSLKTDTAFGKDFQPIAKKLCQHYFRYFILSYDNAPAAMSEIILNHLEDTTKSIGDQALWKSSLVNLVESQVTAIVLMINFVNRFVLLSGALTKESSAIIRNFLSRKGAISLIAKAIAALEETSETVFKQAKDKTLSMKTLVRSFLDSFLENQILKEGYVTEAFVDVQDARTAFFQELLEGSVHLVKLNPETQHFSSDVGVAQAHQRLINSVLRFARDVINLVFFSAIDNPAKQEMVDYFYQNLFGPTLQFSKRVISADSRETCTQLAKYSTLKPEALNIIIHEVDGYKKAFEKFANMEAKTFKFIIEAELKAMESIPPSNAKKSFIEIISTMVRSYNEIAGILNSNMEALVDHSSSLAEINIRICNKLFECLREFDSKKLQAYFKKQLSESDYRTFCRFVLEAVGNSTPIFQKLSKSDEPTKTSKAIDELYLLCTSLLKRDNELEIFKLANNDDERIVLVNLFATFELNPEKFEQFVTEGPELLLWIIQAAENTDKSFWFLYLLVKTLALDCDFKDTILMHTVSQGMLKIDCTSSSGDFNNNFFKTFYHDLFEKIQKEVLTSDDDGKLRLALSSPTLKDLPYIDPEHLTLSTRGNSMFQTFLRAIELSATRPQQLKGFLTILANLIPFHPHLVILLSKTTFDHLSRSVKKSPLQLQLQMYASGPEKQSFLNYLLRICFSRNEGGNLFLLINALIGPQIQNQLVLYNKELIPTVTYHRHLIAQWLIDLIDYLSFSAHELEETAINSIVEVTKLLFRDVHLLSREEVELYYRVCSKCFGMFSASVTLSNPRKLEKYRTLLNCLFTYKQLHYSKITSECLDQNYPELLFNFDSMIANGVRDFFSKQQTTENILQFTNIAEEKSALLSEQLNSTSGLRVIGKSFENIDHLASIHNLSKVHFGARLARSHLSSLMNAGRLNLPTFENETPLVISLMSSMNLNDLKIGAKAEEKDNPQDTGSTSKSIYEKLMEQKEAYAGSRINTTIKPNTLATDLRFEDFISGSDPKAELAELARVVKAKFRKTFEPILGQKFEGHLHTRRIFSSLKSSYTEKELMDFLNRLSRKEYIAFLLFSDEEVFNKQPQQKHLPSEKTFYQEHTSDPSKNSESKSSEEKTRLERLVTFGTKSSNKSLYDKLESLMIERIDCSVVNNHPEREIHHKPEKLVGDKEPQFYQQVCTILDDYLEKKKANTKKQERRNNIVPIPDDLLEKFILPLLTLHQVSATAVANKLEETLVEAVDLLRWLDLMLIIISLPDQKLQDLKRIFKDHFNYDPICKLSFNAVRGIINDALSIILLPRMCEPICLGNFEVVIKKIESELGVLPLKQKLLEISSLHYRKDSTFIQLWVGSLEKHDNERLSSPQAGEVLFAAIVETGRHWNSNAKDSVNAETVMSDYLFVFSARGLFHSIKYKIPAVHMFLAAKDPKAFELLLAAYSTSEDRAKLKSLKEICENIHRALKGTKVDAKTLQQNVHLFEEKSRGLNAMHLALIRFCQEVIERFHSNLFLREDQKNSLSAFSDLLKEYVSNTLPLGLFIYTVANLEKLELKIGFEPNKEALEFINCACSYIIIFYRLRQLQEELEYALHVAMELESQEVALLRIKSRAASMHPDKQKASLKLNKSLSAANSEMLLSPQEHMARLASKCNKVFNAFVNMDRESYTIMTMVPWVIPQSIRLQFIRDKLTKPNDAPVTKLYLRRETILEDTLFNFDSMKITPSLKLDIEFMGEAGIDQGGLTTEWASQVLKTLLDPSYGLFHLSSNNVSLQPSPISAIIPSNYKYYRLVGRVVGYVIANKISVGVNFTKPMVKQLLGAPLTAADLNDVDPDLSNSLQWMLENEIDADLLMQEFSFEFQFLDKYYTIDLSEELADQCVDEDNKKLFVKQLIYHKLSKSIEVPLAEIKAGITELVPPVLLKLLTPADLHSLLAGETNIDVEEMKKYAKLSPFPPTQNIIDWFWEIMKELEKDQLSAFLFFITGSSRVGFGGFKEHPITLNRSLQSADSLPLAHTCFSMIDLPDYHTKGAMKEKLLKAILEGQGFYMA